MTNGADALCDTLLANDIDVCFANPGTSEMHFVAALDRKPAMRCILGLFEGVVTGAADGYARMAEKPAATLLHTGPGLANGLANMHNARRASAPMVNVVGDHASYHLPNDAPLTSDIEALARPMSKYVRRIAQAEDVSRATAEAITQACNPPTGVTTLILPADAAWNTLPDDTPIHRSNHRAPSQIDEARLPAVIKALTAAGGKPALMLAGAALRAGPLRRAGQIAEKTGARLLAPQSNARVERGAGRTPIDRVPYVVDVAQEFLKGITHLILIGAQRPVTFFAYPGKPTTPLPIGCEVITLADEADDGPGALDILAQALGLPDTAPPSSTSAAKRPDPATGALTPDAIASAVGHYLPDNAIICDEAITSGRDLFTYTHGAAPHDYLQLTGGAIGEGLPLALGAAVACPDRKVVGLQADGSGMYTNQALWTIARENLDVCLVIFANHSYAILHGELQNVGAGAPGRNASQMLNLDDPAIDWVKLANSMGIEAARATATEEFNTLFKSAMSRKGPFLIEAAI